MRFCTHRHKYYGGIDLHTSLMYVCITDSAGEVLVHKNLKTAPEALMRVIEPYREDRAVAAQLAERGKRTGNERADRAKPASRVHRRPHRWQ